MIRILIVDDSETVRQLMTHELNRQDDMQVVGVSTNGTDAIQQAKRLCPDIITMDLMMPVMNGLTAIREIMSTQPIPIIIVSQHIQQNNKKQYNEALKAGAVAIANKPTLPGHPDHDKTLTYLLKTIRLMSDIRVITRRKKKSNVQIRPTKSPALCPPPLRTDGSVLTKNFDLILIGASTGGPMVLSKIFTRLPVPYPIPILVVQHIAPGFLSGFVDWLQKTTGHQVQIAKPGLLPQPGQIYFAPDDKHMVLASDGTIALSNDAKKHSLRPAISHLFRSALTINPQKTIAILLTGMGIDGANELNLLKKAGATTIIQDETSCIVFGMPGEAQKLGAAQHILPPNQIADLLNQLICTQP